MCMPGTYVATYYVCIHVLLFIQLCDEDSVEYIEPVYPVTLPTTPPTSTTNDSGSGGSPETEIVSTHIQPTSTIVSDATSQVDSVGKVTVDVASETTIQPTPTLNPTSTPEVTCRKLHGELLSVNNYRVMFEYDLPAPRVNDLYHLLESVKEVDKNFDLNKMKPFFKGPVKGFDYYGLNKNAIMMVRWCYICQLTSMVTNK